MKCTFSAISHAEFDITEDMDESTPLAELPFPAERFAADDVVGLEAAYAPYLAKIPSDVQQKIADAMEHSYWIPISSEGITWDGETTGIHVRDKATETPYLLEFMPDRLVVLVFVKDSETPFAYQISWELKAAAEHALDYLQSEEDLMQYLIPYEPHGGVTVYEVWEAVDAVSQNNY